MSNVAIPQDLCTKIFTLVSDGHLSLSGTAVIETDPDQAQHKLELELFDSAQKLNSYLSSLKARAFPPVPAELLKQTRGIKRSGPLTPREVRQISKNLSRDF